MNRIHIYIRIISGSFASSSKEHNLRPLLELIRVSNAKAKILVHRDRDYLRIDEAQRWEIDIRNMSAEPFLAHGVSVESHFLNVQHLAELNVTPKEELGELLAAATATSRQSSIEKYVNGRTDIEKRRRAHLVS